jgi:hypothetical protein
MNSKNRRGGKMPVIDVKMGVSSEATASYAQRERLRNDYKWIYEQKTALCRDFQNKYIAVQNRKVVLAEDNVYDLLKKMRASGLKPDKYAVEYLSEQPACFLL